MFTQWTVHEPPCVPMVLSCKICWQVDGYTSSDRRCHAWGVLMSQAEAAARLAGNTLNSFKPHTESMLPSLPPRPPSSPTPTSHTPEPDTLEGLVAAQHESSLAKIKNTPLGSFAAEVPPLNLV